MVGGLFVTLALGFTLGVLSSIVASVLTNYVLSPRIAWSSSISKALDHRVPGGGI